jgi:nickel superoxide dismutase
MKCLNILPGRNKKEENMKRTFSLTLILLVFISSTALPHCQIPCGIYGDEMRFNMMKEDIRTVEKSMKMITELGGKETKDYNQIVRWVDNKEHHADKISDTVTYYFMAQRIAPAVKESSEGYSDYTAKLVLLHKLLYYSMKCKQTTDLSYVDKMRHILEDFRNIYMEK